MRRMGSGQDKRARKRPCTRNGQHPHPSSPPSVEGRTLQKWRCFLGLGPRESCHKINRLRAPSASDFQTHHHQAAAFGVQELVILPFLVHSGSEQHRAVCVSCVGAVRALLMVMSTASCAPWCIVHLRQRSPHSCHGAWCCCELWPLLPCTLWPKSFGDRTALVRSLPDLGQAARCLPVVQRETQPLQHQWCGTIGVQP